MKLGLIIIIITCFLIANIYHDGKYVAILKTWKKYYQMALIAFLGLSAYLFIRKYPNHSNNLLINANNLIKYMPIDKDTGNLLSPILDLTSKSLSSQNQCEPIMTPQQTRMLNSGKGTKRSVSETKKKFIASQQDWKCGKCNKQLNAWFEVDHKIRLEHGGSNEIHNLIALCRDCHGEKTTMENL